jgi:hypothetical protein
MSSTNSTTARRTSRPLELSIVNMSDGPLVRSDSRSAVTRTPALRPGLLEAGNRAAVARSAAAAATADWPRARCASTRENVRDPDRSATHPLTAAG